MTKSQIKRLDALWSKAVKIAAKECCEYCGKKECLNSHHIFGRRCYTVRWDLGNGVCLCAGHHKLSGSFSAHETPTEFDAWITKKRTQDWMDKLTLKKNTVLKYDSLWFEERKKLFEEIINSTSV